MLEQFDLPYAVAAKPAEQAPRSRQRDLAAALRGFREFGAATIETVTASPDGLRRVPTFVNEFWTSAQRAASRLHEISYRACFKPQLPRFFIGRLTAPGEVVYDPFMGRGTTPIEAALMDRVAFGNDINPLSGMLVGPRFAPPRPEEVSARLAGIPLATKSPLWEELLVFYERKTLGEITALKEYLIRRARDGELDRIDEWIRMVALNRLTGHSPGFFSVYTLPPNQAVSLKSQQKINFNRGQTPTYRDVRKIVLKKSRQLVSDMAPADQRRLGALAAQHRLVNRPAARTDAIPAGSVSLVVTSPPFLDVVDYAGDNWLRCWFAGIDPASVKLTVTSRLEAWQEEMTRVFAELARVLRPGGQVAFEVGEVRRGKVKLEETVIGCGASAGLEPVLVLINEQEFTKTANCWGVDNNSKGTNSNRVVVFRKAE